MYRRMVIQILGQAAMICGGILLIVAGSSRNPRHYEIQPFNNNPRLFYKKLETIRTTQNHWRFVMYIHGFPKTTITSSIR